MTRIIDGKTAAAAVIETVRTQAAQLERETGTRPGLSVIIVGDDPASHAYGSGSDSPFGLPVEQVLATESRTAILLERGGEFATAGIPKLASTQRARSAPPQKLASQSPRRFRMCRAAARADLRWPRGDEPTR